MKKGKRLLALVVALSLVAGLAPMSSTSYAEEMEATLNETLVFEDNFDTETWNSSYWNYTTESQEKYYGVRNNGVAPLGYNSNATDSARNMSKSKLTDVHIKADVCVTAAQDRWSSRDQYHLLFVRGEDGSAKNSVAFGFKTEYNAENSSLVVAKYNHTDTPEILYETEATYSIGGKATLELYVVGTLVIAKCNKTTIYSGTVAGINQDAGYCGILDRRAVTLLEGVSSLPDSPTYGEDYTKNGYFDNFYLYKDVKLDGFKVNGSVIINQTGVGVADITLTSNGVEVGELQDVSVTVPDLAGKGCSLYDGNYNVTTTLLGEEMKAVSNRVFVVNSLDDAVMSMSDGRWEGATDGATKNFTVDALGKATLKNNAYSVLDLNGDNTAYTNFYAEYTLNVSNISDSTSSLFYNRFNITGRSSNTNSYSSDVLYDTRTTQDMFWARFVKDKNNSSPVGQYAKGVSDDDVAIGKSMTIGMLVYDKEVKFTINGETVGTSSEAEVISNGYFAIYNEVVSRDKDNVPNPTAIATIDDFILVPLSGKTVVDLEVSEIAEVQRYGTITIPSVTPIYNWPNADDAATQEGVTIEEFDNTRLGEQTVTVKYTKNNVTVAKEVTVNVVDNSVATLVDEDFDDGQNPFDEWATIKEVEIKDVDNDGDTEVLVGEEANVKSADTFKDGYIEAKLAINEWTATEDGTKYPMVLDCKRAASGGARVEARFVVTKASDDYSAYFELVVREGKNLGSESTIRKTVKTLSDFALGREYTVRLTCIGNYVEVMLDDTILQYAFTADTLDTVDGTYGFTNVAGVTATLDDLKVVEYIPYTIDVDAEQAVTLPSYPIVQDTKTEATRTEFAPGEQVVLTVPEDKQLAVGGLRYTIDGVSTPYSITQRRHGAGNEQDVCNQFVFNMPSGNIMLTADYYGDGEEETNANIGIKGVDIRKKTEDKKLGLRFSSRAYQTYAKDDVVYKLDEVGTLLFNEKVTSITDDIKDACRTSEGGIYKDGDTTIGKCITATKAQDICNDFIDWGLILTYEADSEFIDTEYTACSYAKYVDDNNTEIYVYGDTTTYSIATVAESIGYEIQ